MRQVVTSGDMKVGLVDVDSSVLSILNSNASREVRRH